MPINTRQEASEKQTTGNTVAIMTAAVRTDIADPLERLAAIHAATSRSKEVSNAIGARELTDLTKHAPAPTILLASKLLLLGGFGGNPKLPFHNLCISNVPGPPFPLYFLGAKLELFSVVAPVSDGFTMFFAVTSYDGKLIVTLTSVPEIVPDPAFLAQCLRESFEDMKRAAQASLKPAKRRRNAKATPRVAA